MSSAVLRKKGEYELFRNVGCTGAVYAIFRKGVWIKNFRDVQKATDYFYEVSKNAVEEETSQTGVKPASVETTPSPEPVQANAEPVNEPVKKKK